MQTTASGTLQAGDFVRRIRFGESNGEPNIIPPSVSLSGAAHLGDMPYFMVGDAAFPLKPLFATQQRFVSFWFFLSITDFKHNPTLVLHYIQFNLDLNTLHDFKLPVNEVIIHANQKALQLLVIFKVFNGFSTHTTR